MLVVHDGMCSVHFFGEYFQPPKIVTVITCHLIVNTLQMSKIQFDVNVVNGVAFDVANGVLPARWIELYYFRFNQSESLLHAYISLIEFYKICNSIYYLDV